MNIKNLAEKLLLSKLRVFMKTENTSDLTCFIYAVLMPREKPCRNAQNYGSITMCIFWALRISNTKSFIFSFYILMIFLVWSSWVILQDVFYKLIDKSTIWLVGYYIIVNLIVALLNDIIVNIPSNLFFAYESSNYYIQRIDWMI